MTTTVSGKLNKDARESMTTQGDVMFLVSVGKKEKDKQNNVDLWANYQAALFAKAGKQADFYRDVLKEGCIVSISGSGLIPRIWGDNNDKISLSMQNSKLDYGFNPTQGQLQAQQQPNQQSAPKATSYQAPPVNDSFDDDIPF